MSRGFVCAIVELELKTMHVLTRGELWGGEARGGSKMQCSRLKTTLPRAAVAERLWAAVGEDFLGGACL
jgi:hypothetical protein